MHIITRSYEYPDKILILADGRVLLDQSGSRTPLGYKQEKYEPLGNWKEGTCWKGEANLVKAIKRELDKCGVDYSLPSLFRHRGEYNSHHDLVVVDKVCPVPKEEEFTITQQRWSGLHLTWVSPFLELPIKVQEGIRGMHNSN